MKKTLYDLLEVSQSAGQDTIIASHQRLVAKIADTDPDAENKRKFLDEAFATLSQPVRRARYDMTLADATAVPQPVIQGNDGASAIKNLLIAGLLIGVCGLGYSKYAKDKETAFIEKERARAAEVLAATQRAEQAELLAAKEGRAEELRQQLRLEQQQRYETDAARRQGAQVSQVNANAEDRARRESESQARQRQREQEYTQRQQQSEAQNRLAREKAQLRQLESENARYRKFSVN